jgi:hypothetical protein
MKAIAWLPAEAQEWLGHYGYFLDGVWDRFERDGEWPNPVDVQRELRSADPTRRVTHALECMPNFLARREWSPPRLVLSMFGIACCDRARPLLEKYLRVAELALRRFDSPTLPNRLRRSDVVEDLHLSASETDRLSVLLALDAPFLGSGSISIDDWDREVDPRAEEFEGIEDVDDLLDFLATQRRLGEGADLAAALAVEVPPTVSNPQSPRRADPTERIMVLSTVSSAAATVITSILTLNFPVSPFSLGVVMFFFSLTAALLLLRKRPMVAAIVVLSATALGCGAGAFLAPDPPSRPVKYFVVSTGGKATVIPSIAPSVIAPIARNQVLGSGEAVEVMCTLANADGHWAKLTDGTFLRAGFLASEVGGETAPSC